MIITPVPSKSKVVTAVTATAASFGAAMTSGQFWALTSTTNCWVAQADTPVAVANTAGSTLLAAGRTIYLDGRNGVDASVVRDTADGHASLTPVMVF